MFEQLQKEVWQANLLLAKYQLAIHTWGNVSQLSEDGKYFAIKPSGVPYQDLKVSDIVVLDLQGKIVKGNLKPSSDMPTHLYLYQKSSILKGIVHTHSPFAIAFAQAGKHITCLGTTHADYFYGSIICTRALKTKEINNQYELNTGKVIVEAWKKYHIDPHSNPAILVKNHGPFVYSTKSGIEAVNKAKTLEEVAKMAIYTNLINANVQEAPKFLQQKHYERKHGKNAYYGQ